MNGGNEMSIQGEIPGAAVILLHTHECDDARPYLVKQDVLAIWQCAHDVCIVSVAAACISRRCSLHPVAQFQVRELIQVSIGVKAEIERR